jgi:hypothetical protein
VAGQEEAVPGPEGKKGLPKLLKRHPPLPAADCQN